ncbi:hypothetical protein KC361_g133 [Hortaea werneckii]|nr:hypothetical protein KC361_g133 [Hortaea werneckii]
MPPVQPSGSSARHYPSTKSWQRGKRPIRTFPPYYCKQCQPTEPTSYQEWGERSKTHLHINLPSILPRLLELTQDALDALPDGARVAGRTTRKGSQDLRTAAWRGVVDEEVREMFLQIADGFLAEADGVVFARAMRNVGQMTEDVVRERLQLRVLLDIHHVQKLLHEGTGEERHKHRAVVRRNLQSLQDIPYDPRELLSSWKCQPSALMMRCKSVILELSLKAAFVSMSSLKPASQSTNGHARRGSLPPTTNVTKVDQYELFSGVRPSVKIRRTIGKANAHNLRHSTVLVLVGPVSVHGLREILEVIPCGFRQAIGHKIHRIRHDHRAGHAEAIGSLIARFLLHVSEVRGEPMAINLSAHSPTNMLLHIVVLQLARTSAESTHRLLPDEPTRIIPIDVCLSFWLRERIEIPLSPARIFPMTWYRHFIGILLRIEQLVAYRVLRLGSFANSAFFPSTTARLFWNLAFLAGTKLLASSFDLAIVRGEDKALSLSSSSPGQIASNVASSRTTIRSMAFVMSCMAKLVPPTSFWILGRSVSLTRMNNRIMRGANRQLRPSVLFKLPNIKLKTAPLMRGCSFFLSASSSASSSGGIIRGFAPIRDFTACSPADCDVRRMSV